jgi:hypothetical protein
MDEKMKMLFNFANNLPATNNIRSSAINPISMTDATDNKNSFAIDKLVFTK